MHSSIHQKYPSNLLKINSLNTGTCVIFQILFFLHFSFLHTLKSTVEQSCCCCCACYRPCLQYTNRCKNIIFFGYNRYLLFGLFIYFLYFHYGTTVLLHEYIAFARINFNITALSQHKIQQEITTFDKKKKKMRKQKQKSLHTNLLKHGKLFSTKFVYSILWQNVSAVGGILCGTEFQVLHQ